MEFREWITRKYIDWRGDAIGNERSISEFARMIDVDKTQVSKWMNGQIVAGLKNAVKIAKYYPEVYDVLGLEKPLSDGQLPPSLASAMKAAMSEYISEVTALGLSGDSPEAENIAIEVFSRHGFEFKRKV